MFREYKSHSWIARELDINPAHVWNAVRKDYASPTLVNALGINRTRTRICADVSKEQREALHELAAGEGMSWSEWCRVQAINFNIRRGVCPDCGNDKCMADGKTGLWCPACDASYLL